MSLIAPQAIIIFGLWTGIPHTVALLDYPYQLHLAAYIPAPGEARLQEDRERFVRETFNGDYPSPEAIKAKIITARAKLLTTPGVCLLEVGTFYARMD